MFSKAPTADFVFADHTRYTTTAVTQTLKRISQLIRSKQYSSSAGGGRRHLMLLDGKFIAYFVQQLHQMHRVAWCCQLHKPRNVGLNQVHVQHHGMHWMLAQSVQKINTRHEDAGA